MDLQAASFVRRVTFLLAGGPAKIMPQSTVEAGRLAASVEWLANVSANQLAQANVAVEGLSNELSGAVLRLSGEAEARNQTWEKKLSTAKAEWMRALDGVRADCRAQLVEADELIRLQQEQATALKEESALRQSQRELVQQRLAAAEAEKRKMLVRTRAAVRKAEAAEAEAAEATAAADQQAAEHARARKRAEAERDVLVAALEFTTLEAAVDGLGRLLRDRNRYRYRSGTGAVALHVSQNF